MSNNIENKLKEIETSFENIQLELSNPNIERDKRIEMSKKLSVLEQILKKKKLWKNYKIVYLIRKSY